jgi:hypothetical protein
LSSRHFLLLFGNLWWTIPIRRQCFYGLREIFFENLDFFWLSTLFHTFINSRKGCLWEYLVKEGDDY